jgi:hypothetical protein
MGMVLRPFDRLRRLRNNAEYPQPDTPTLKSDDVTRDIPKIEEILDLAQRRRSAGPGAAGYVLADGLPAGFVGPRLPGAGDLLLQLLEEQD